MHRISGRCSQPIGVGSWLSAMVTADPSGFGVVRTLGTVASTGVSGGAARGRSPGSGTAAGPRGPAAGASPPDIRREHLDRDAAMPDVVAVSGPADDAHVIDGGAGRGCIDVALRVAGDAGNVSPYRVGQLSREHGQFGQEVEGLFGCGAFARQRGVVVVQPVGCLVEQLVEVGAEGLARRE